tara:strand:+ start:1463 stop:1597 length:135 start_codon:yes stop_codon:yes gene_type:complete
MPGKAACSKLKGKAKADCLAYKGKYAQNNPIKGSLHPRKTKKGY